MACNVQSAKNGSIRKGSMLDVKDISQVERGIKKLIDNDLTDQSKEKMRTALDYYRGKHDILDYRLYYIDDTGQPKEEKYRSNTKIAHGFFTELVDQKVQYLLSNPIEIQTEQQELQEYLAEYVNEEFQLVLQELVEGASQKAIEYVFWRIDKDGRLVFEVADALKMIPIYNHDNQMEQVLYYVKDEIVVDGKTKEVKKIQLWTKDAIHYFVYADNKVRLDDTVPVNPAPHLLVKDKKNEEVLGKGYGRLPFMVLHNNREKLTDLEPIKDLIDDYDLMACALSNNLIDFDHPIYAVRGFEGDSFDKLVTNLKAKKTVGVGPDGGLDVKTVDIPIEARKEKLRIDKEAIYKFGMGFDSSQTGDGNITNVVIKSRYSLLDLKCNKIEVRLRRIIKQMLELIVENINQRYSKAYNTSDIEIIITRDIMANEVDNATIAKTEADTKQVAIQTILDAAPRLDSRTVLELLAGILEIDPDEVEQALEEEEYQGNLAIDTEVEDGVEPVSEGDATFTTTTGPEG